MEKSQKNSWRLVPKHRAIFSPEFPSHKTSKFLDKKMSQEIFAQLHFLTFLTLFRYFLDKKCLARAFS